MIVMLEQVFSDSYICWVFCSLRLQTSRLHFVINKHQKCELQWLAALNHSKIKYYNFFFFYLNYFESHLFYVENCDGQLSISVCFMDDYGLESTFVCVFCCHGKIEIDFVLSLCHGNKKLPWCKFPEGITRCFFYHNTISCKTFKQNISCRKVEEQVFLSTHVNRICKSCHISTFREHFNVYYP